MNCERLRELLLDHADGLLGADDAEGARGHLAACADCRLLQEEVRRNFAAMDSWEDEELPAGSWERLRARLPTPGVAAPAVATVPAATGRRWVRLAFPFAAGLATAAGLVVAFVPRGAAPVSANPPAAEVPAPAPAVAPPAPVLAGGDRARPALRRGERPLRFDDSEAGVVRVLHLPGDLRPDDVMLIHDEQPPVPAGGVR